MQRRRNKTFQFEIEWNEVEDLFKKELNIYELDWLDLNNYINEKNQKFLNIMTEFFNSRNNKINPKRGDIIHLAFIENHRQDGFLFYDGEKVIYPGLENGNDQYNIPVIFKIPEFPPDYWDDSEFMNPLLYTLVFDINEKTKITIIQDFYIQNVYGLDKDIYIKHILNENKEFNLHVRIYKESKHNYNIIMLNYDENDAEEILKYFIENGICSSLTATNLDYYPENENIPCDEVYEEIIKYVDPKKTIYLI